MGASVTQIDDLLATPASQIPPSSRQEWCARILPALQILKFDAGLNPDPTRDFSEPQYTVAKATQKVWLRPFGNGHMDSNPVVIPGGCQPAGGSDGQMDIRTPTGVWYLAGYIPPGGNAFQRAQAYVANWFRPGQYDGYAWGASFTPNTAKGNRYTYAPAYPLNAVTPTPAEIIAGGIDHAIGLAVPASISMTGPEAPSSITDIDDPRIGSVFGASCSPAPRLESRALRSDLSKSVPDGYSFALNPAKWTDAAILAWALELPACVELRIAFATCFRDYRLISGCQTTGPGGGCFIPLDGSPEAKIQWKAMGLTATTDLFGGLFTSLDDIIALAPPTSIDAKGNRFTRDVAAVSVSY